MIIIQDEDAQLLAEMAEKAKYHEGCYVARDEHQPCDATRQLRWTGRALCRILKRAHGEDVPEPVPVERVEPRITVEVRRWEGIDIISPELRRKLGG